MQLESRYIAVVEPDGDGWTASVPDLPCCFSDGATLEEAQVGIKEAVRLWLETARKKGWAVPPPKTTTLPIAV